MILNKTKQMFFDCHAGGSTFYLVCQRLGHYKAAMIMEMNDDIPRSFKAQQLLFMRRKVRVLINRAQRKLERARKRN